MFVNETGRTLVVLNDSTGTSYIAPSRHRGQALVVIVPSAQWMRNAENIALRMAAAGIRDYRRPTAVRVPWH